MEQIRSITDFAKTRDYLTRDLVQVLGPMPPAGTLPWVRYNFFKVKPGKDADDRKAWEKYNKPVFDKLVADGTVLAFGLSEQEAITHLFTGFTDPDASRSELVRSLIFHLPAPK